MKTFKHIIGILLLVLIFSGFFIMTATDIGIIKALLTWCAAIVLALVLVLAVIFISE